MSTLLRLTLAASLLVPANAALAADEFQPALEAYMNSSIVGWASDPMLLDAIRAANAQSEGMSQARIDELDQMWRAEVGTGSTPTITPILENPVSDFLREQVSASGGTMTEVFIMDQHGLNVAASGVTSDMWQGDEAKFTETYGMGAGSVHFGDVEFDESSQSYQGQISMTIVDPDTGEVIGAMTVGVNADALL